MLVAPAKQGFPGALHEHPPVSFGEQLAPVALLAALQAAGKLGQITVVAFDEDPVTLGAVKEGSFASTIVQQPFEWGYQGMKLMAAYLEGDKSGIPEDKLIIVPTKVIDQSNVDEFEANLKAARAAKLNLSSKLLRLATEVIQ